MTKHLCDFCGADVTNKPSGAIHGIADTDYGGNGTDTDAFDAVCRRWYAKFRKWLKEMGHA